MVIIHRQQFGLARFEPALGGTGLALRTMAVATGVVGDLNLSAIFTAQHVAAERSTAALLNGAHDLELAETDVSGIGLAPRRTLIAEDVRDLKGRHRR